MNICRVKILFGALPKEHLQAVKMSNKNIEIVYPKDIYSLLQGIIQLFAKCIPTVCFKV